MAVWLILAVAFTADLVDYAQAACSPCNFQWMENRDKCYRYYPDHLSYTEAQAFCQRLKYHGRSGSLATATDAENILFILKYADNIFNNVIGVDVPPFIWLNTPAMNTTTSDLQLILNEPFGQTSDVTPCENNPVVDNEAYRVGGTPQMVPGPEIVEQPCAVHAPVGSYLDLGDFAGTCVSDPGLCESQSMTWTIWLKIDTPAADKDYWYYLSSGGQTGKARGIALLLNKNDGRFVIAVKTGSLWASWKYDKSKIPLDEWFHFAFTVNVSSTVSMDLEAFVNGEMINADTINQKGTSGSDGRTRLYFGLGNTYNKPSTDRADLYGGSAAYSNLVVFDGLLSAKQIANLYKCGSVDWRPKILNFTMTNEGITNNPIRLECTAGGDVIAWSLLHTNNHNNASWENLGTTSGAGYTIEAVNAARCVIRSTLVIYRNHGLPLEGAVVVCTAESYRLREKASMFIYPGKHVNIGRSDRGSFGPFMRVEGNKETQFIIQDGDNPDTYCDSAPPTVASDLDGSCSADQQKYPFICQM